MKCMKAIKACEKSDQFSLAMSVYEEMKVRGIARTAVTYAALISVAERTGHHLEAVQIYREISKKDSSIELSADICNAWSVVPTTKSCSTPNPHTYIHTSTH